MKNGEEGYGTGSVVYPYPSGVKYFLRSVRLWPVQVYERITRIPITVTLVRMANSDAFLLFKCSDLC